MARPKSAMASATVSALTSSAARRSCARSAKKSEVCAGVAKGAAALLGRATVLGSRERDSGSTERLCSAVRGRELDGVPCREPCELTLSAVRRRALVGNAEPGRCRETEGPAEPGRKKLAGPAEPGRKKVAGPAEDGRTEVDSPEPRRKGVDRPAESERINVLAPEPRRRMLAGSAGLGRKGLDGPEILSPNVEQPMASIVFRNRPSEREGEGAPESAGRQTR